MPHFADRLLAAVKGRRTPLCVGLDPRWPWLPASIRRRYPETRAGRASAYEEFCRRVLDVVSPLVAVVKPQSAFFEACGPEGLHALRHVQRHARRLGLLTILDAKRNDIASTAEAYAEAAFDVYEADAVTINPYLGHDSIAPFLEAARQREGALFVLVRTSNPGASQFQDLACDGAPLHERVAAAVRGWNDENLGTLGFGDVGAVVGATNPAELVRLRMLVPNALFLVPGYGAQGGSASDVKAAFRADGLGAVINSSRAILYPYKPDDPHWEAQVDHAARRAIRELAF